MGSAANSPWLTSPSTDQRLWRDQGACGKFRISGSAPELRNQNLFSIPMDVCVRAKSFQTCPTLCDAMDCSQPGSSVRGILQARILEWVATPSSRGIPDPGIELTSLRSPALAGRFFTTIAT